MSLNLGLLNSIIPFIIAFAAVAFFTPYVRLVMLKADITDNPIVSEHSHKKGTPTMGGLAIILGMLLILSLYYQNKLVVLTVGLMVVAAVIGLLDDLLGFRIKEFQKVVKNIYSKPVEIGMIALDPGNEARIITSKAKEQLNILVNQNKVKVIREIPIKSELKDRNKILAQIMVSLFLVVSGAIPTTLSGFYVGVLAIPIAIIGVVGFINAVNLIDGMDGLASGILGMASVACGVFSILTGRLDTAIIFMAIGGACFGFLVWNRLPASIFMGDVGSFALGGLYAAAAIMGNVIIFAIVVLAVPIISVIISLMHRAGIINLAVEPLHHTLNHKGWSESKIVLTYWLATLIICLVALYFYHFFR